jgi:hypothetical protein
MHPRSLVHRLPCSTHLHTASHHACQWTWDLPVHGRPPLVVMTSLCWDHDLHKVMVVVVVVMAAAAFTVLSHELQFPHPSHAPPRPSCQSVCCVAASGAIDGHVTIDYRAGSALVSFMYLCLNLTCIRNGRACGLAVAGGGVAAVAAAAADDDDLDHICCYGNISNFPFRSWQPPAGTRGKNITSTFTAPPQRPQLLAAPGAVAVQVPSHKFSNQALG